jgi:hypothetical protein
MWIRQWIRRNVLMTALVLQLSQTIALAQSEVRAVPKPGKGNSAATEEISVLSVGISNYAKAPRLAYTTTDAENIGMAYREIAQLTKSGVEVLTDADDSSPFTAKRLASEVQRFLSSRARNSTAVLFFSGHGYRTEMGDFFLATSEFDTKDPAQTGYPLDELRKQLSECPARTKIVILDCCFAGAFGAAKGVDPGENNDDVAGSFRSVPGCVAITASTGGQESIESPVLKAGIFTHWLVKGLRGQANTRIDDVIDVAELFSFVSDNVKRETNEAQTPSWSLDQAAEMPVIMPLIRPDRPSDRVGLLPFPLGTNPQTLETLVDIVERFPANQPRRSIGLMKWVLSEAMPRSEIAVRAQKQLDLLNESILSGKIKLPEEKEGGEIDP